MFMYSAGFTWPLFKYSTNFGSVVLYLTIIAYLMMCAGLCHYSRRRLKKVPVDYKWGEIYLTLVLTLEIFCFSISFSASLKFLVTGEESFEESMVVFVLSLVLFLVVVVGCCVIRNFKVLRASDSTAKESRFVRRIKGSLKGLRRRRRGKTGRKGLEEDLMGYGFGAGLSSTDSANLNEQPVSSIDTFLTMPENLDQKRNKESNL